MLACAGLRPQAQSEAQAKTVKNTVFSSFFCFFADPALILISYR